MLGVLCIEEEERSLHELSLKYNAHQRMKDIVYETFCIILFGLALQFWIQHPAPEYVLLLCIFSGLLSEGAMKLLFDYAHTGKIYSSFSSLGNTIGTTVTTRNCKHLFPSEGKWPFFADTILSAIAATLIAQSIADIDLTWRQLNILMIPLIARHGLKKLFSYQSVRHFLEATENNIIVPCLKQAKESTTQCVRKTASTLLGQYSQRFFPDPPAQRPPVALDPSQSRYDRLF